MRECNSEQRGMCYAYVQNLGDYKKFRANAINDEDMIRESEAYRAHADMLYGALEATAPQVPKLEGRCDECLIDEAYLIGTDPRWDGFKPLED